MQRDDMVFVPQTASKDGINNRNREYIPVVQSWERALQRSMYWYNKP